MTAEPWDHYGDWWVNGFTDGADPEYVEQILPLLAAEIAGTTDILDVGCGEGQLARLAVAVGVRRVVGVEPSGRLLDVARRRAGGPEYCAAQVEALPFADGVFDAVVCCLVLEHVRELDRAIGEIARVLRRDGRLALFLNHPLLLAPQSGWMVEAGSEPAETFWRMKRYLGESIAEEELDDGVLVPLWYRPLGRYMNALAASGLYITRMVEPWPAPGFIAQHPALRETPPIPRLLYLRALNHPLR